MGAEARIAERRRMVESIFAAGADAGYQYARAHRWSIRRNEHLPVMPVLVWDEAGKLAFTGWETT